MTTTTLASMPAPAPFSMNPGAFRTASSLPDPVGRQKDHAGQKAAFLDQLKTSPSETDEIDDEIGAQLDLSDVPDTPRYGLGQSSSPSVSPLLSQQNSPVAPLLDPNILKTTGADSFAAQVGNTPSGCGGCLSTQNDPADQYQATGTNAVSDDEDDELATRNYDFKYKPEQDMQLLHSAVYSVGFGFNGGISSYQNNYMLDQPQTDYIAASLNSALEAGYSPIMLGVSGTETTRNAAEYNIASQNLVADRNTMQLVTAGYTREAEDDLAPQIIPYEVGMLVQMYARPDGQQKIYLMAWHLGQTGQNLAQSLDNLNLLPHVDVFIAGQYLGPGPISPGYYLIGTQDEADVIAELKGLGDPRMSLETSGMNAKSWWQPKDSVDAIKLRYTDLIRDALVRSRLMDNDSNGFFPQFSGDPGTDNWRQEQGSMMGIRNIMQLAHSQSGSSATGIQTHRGPLVGSVMVRDSFADTPQQQGFIMRNRVPANAFHHGTMMDEIHVQMPNSEQDNAYTYGGWQQDENGDIHWQESLETVSLNHAGKHADPNIADDWQGFTNEETVQNVDGPVTDDSGLKRRVTTSGFIPPNPVFETQDDDLELMLDEDVPQDFEAVANVQDPDAEDEYHPVPNADLDDNQPKSDSGH